jgi:hypothetical protein
MTSFSLLTDVYFFVNYCFLVSNNRHLKLTLNECDLFGSLTEIILVNIARRRALEANNSTAAQRESNKAQTNGLAYINSEIPHGGKSYLNSDSKEGFFADQFENMANYRAHYEWNRKRDSA